MTHDELLMQRCIELAGNASGRTEPNPMVGAVVSRAGAVLGEGWHHRAGEPHAEVNAIAQARARFGAEALRGATIHVSLEPCAHYGRTPPCADLIISTGLGRVVVGCQDTFSAVAGRGIARLREAGLEVVVGVLAAECRWLNRRFFSCQERRRPWVTLKWARTADGYMGDVVDGSRKTLHISDAWSLRLGHRLRATEAAIAVGAETVRSDDPRLNTRLWPGRDPLRVVVSPTLRVPAAAGLFHDGGPTLLLGGAADEGCFPPSVVRRAWDSGRGVAAQVVEAVHQAGHQSLLVEGGARLLGAFLGEGLWDEAYVQTAAWNLGHHGVTTPQPPSGQQHQWQCGQCHIQHFINANYTL